MRKIYVVFLTLLLLPFLMANTPATIEEVYTWDGLKIETNGQEINAYVERRGKGSSQFNFTFDLGHKKIKFMPDKMPHENNTTMNDFKTDSDTIRKATYSKVEGERIFYYDYQNTASNLPVFADVAEGAKLNGFRPHVVFNIDTAEITGTSKLVLHAFLQKQGQSFFFDVLFPMEIDNLLQISIRYDYRGKSGVLGIGFWGKWQDRTVTRVNGKTEGTRSWWKWISVISGTEGIAGWYDLASTPIVAKNIEEKSIITASAKYKNDYNRALNDERKKHALSLITVDEMFDSNTKLYRVYGDTVDRFMGIDYEVKNTSIIEVLYFYKGEYFHVKGDDILTIANELLGKGPSSTWALIIFIVVVVLLLAFLGKFGGPATKAIKGIFGILFAPFRWIFGLFGRKKS